MIYTVRANGATLRSVAKELYNDENRWLEIYNRNRAAIDANNARNAAKYPQAMPNKWIWAGQTLDVGDPQQQQPPAPAQQQPSDGKSSSWLPWAIGAVIVAIGISLMD